MADATTWSKVTVNMQSTIDTEKTITGITNANPCVVSCVAHGLADGDYVFIEAKGGIVQLNERAFRISNQTADSFELEGIDSTNYGTFSAATLQAVTLGTNIASATTISASGGDFSFLDITTISDEIKRQIPDLPNAIVYTMDHIWDMTDAGQIEMKEASDMQAKRVVQIIFKSGKMMLFAGYVGFSGIPGGSAQALVTSQAVFTMNGTPTFYAS